MSQATVGPQVDVASNELEEWEKENPLFWQTMEDTSNPTYEGLVQLQEDCTPLERAETYKEQGNDFFALGPRKYQEAIFFYSKGLAEPFEDNLKLRTSLHSNRALINLKLSKMKPKEPNKKILTIVQRIMAK